VKERKYCRAPRTCSRVDSSHEPLYILWHAQVPSSSNFKHTSHPYYQATKFKFGIKKYGLN
jgi:hypothetical protein